MAQERIELRFSPGNPNERALIDALGALGDEYGAKGRFLKERLLQGYAAILRELDGFMQESDPMAALDRVAATVDAKHYRVLKVLLTSKVSGHDTVQPQPQAQQVSAPAPVAAPVVERPIQPPAQPVQAVAVPVPVPVEAVTAAPAASVPPEAAAVVVPAVNEAAAQVLAQAPAPVAQPEPEIEAQQLEHVEQAQASAPDAGPADGTDAAVEQPASPPPRKHDWSAFAGIAGAKKGG